MLAELAAVAAAAVSPWAPPVTHWHLADAPHTRHVTLRQVGSPFSTRDDTIPVTAVDGLGTTITTHSSPWQRVLLRVPARARAARLSFRAAITRGGQEGDAIVYAFARRPGARCCQGPPGFANYPVDFSLAGRTLDGSGDDRPPEVAMIDATGPHDSARGWTTVDVPISRRRFEFAWGYRRVPGIWPVGDAVAINVYVDAWAD